MKYSKSKTYTFPGSRFLLELRPGFSFSAAPPPAPQTAPSPQAPAASQPRQAQTHYRSYSSPPPALQDALPALSETKTAAPAPSFSPARQSLPPSSQSPSAPPRTLSPQPAKPPAPPGELPKTALGEIPAKRQRAEALRGSL